MVNIANIDLDSLSIPLFLSESDRITTNNTLNKLKFIEYTLSKMLEVSQFVQNIPQSWKDYLQANIDEFAKLSHELKLVLEENRSGQTSQHLQSWRTAIDRIDRFYDECFRLENNNRFLLSYNAIMSSKSEKLTEQELALAKMRGSLEEEINTSKRLNKELNENISKVVVKEYVKIFEDQISKDKNTARIWLGISIGSLTIVIFLFSLSFANDWFHIAQRDPQTAAIKIIYPNLIAKFFVFSLALYLVSFCFKQYSIYRNLEELNKHRRNALKSFSLFSDTIGKEDVASRNALMLQVAKAIYDHSPTGYLNTKQADSTPNIVDLTKVISTTKT